MLSKNLPSCTLLFMSIVAGPSMAQTASGVPPIREIPKPRSATVTTLAPVTAARAAQVQIADDNAHAPFQAGGFNACTFAGVCTIDFATVPAGHRYLVEHFSCTIYVPAPGVLRYVALLANTFAAPRDFFPLSRSPADSSQYFINSPTLLRFDAGEAPLVYAYGSGGSITDLTCTISGRDILVP